MRRAVVLSLVTGASLLVGCSPSGAPEPGASAPSAGSGSYTAPPAQEAVGTPPVAEYRPGRGVTLDMPATPPDAVVVLVPGGGWGVADPADLVPLAAELAAARLAVVTVTYATASIEQFYPVPAQDVACAAAYAAAEVPGVPVVMVGHSAGAHLSALVALVPDRQDATCPAPSHEPDAVVGLAGVYDVAEAPGLARNLFGVGPADDPAAWTDGNPMTWVAERPDVPFLLIHGTSDATVPDWFTADFAAALEGGGHRVDVRLLPDVDHMQVIEPAAVAAPTVGWIRSVVLAP